MSGRRVCALSFSSPRAVGLILISAFLTACADASVRFPVAEREQEKLEANVSIVRLNASNISSFYETSTTDLATSLPAYHPGEYRIGASDVISVFVFDHPELAIPAGNNQVNTGFQVQTDGTLTFPFIGSIQAKGRTVDELRNEFTERLAKFFPDPQVDVRITGFNSQRVVVGGEVGKPVTVSIRNTPLTLLEAINAAGGLGDDADARAITVRRDGISHRVDLEAFITGGLAGNNPHLKGGDVVSVPRKTLREAYLLGEVIRPATIDLTEEPVTLTQAITRQGGINEARADARGVFVFREVAGQITVYQLDTSTATSLLLGTKFVLRPTDVVYVTKSPLQRWNDTISRILPSVTAARTVHEF